MGASTQSERQEALRNFLEESPEFSDVKSHEYQVLNQVYEEEFEKSVNAGKLPYHEALEEAREKATRRLGFEELQASRKKLPVVNGLVTKKEERRKTASW